MRPLISTIIFTLAFVALAAPFAAQAVWVPGNTLIPCGHDLDGNGKIDSPSALRDVTAGSVTGQKDLNGKLQEACDFDGVVQLAENIISIAIYLAILVAVAMFAFAGWLYLTSAGDTGKMKQAHTIFTNVAIGFIFVLGAWLLVTLILGALVCDPAKNLPPPAPQCTGTLRNLLVSIFKTL